MAMAATWACQIEQDISAMRSSDAEDAQTVSELRSSLRAKLAIAHCCCVVCFGSACFQGTSDHPSTTGAMDGEAAAFLVLHQVQAYLNTFNGGTDQLRGRLATITDQCNHVMAYQVHPLNATIMEDHSLLNDAVRSVFAALPQRVAWEATGDFGCYQAEAEGQVYSINILTGLVLCNGLAPGRLPPAIVAHALYIRLFGSVMFEVEQMQGEQEGIFRTAQSHGGFTYTFHLQGKRLFVDECPVHAEGAMQHKLELLQRTLLCNGIQKFHSTARLPLSACLDCAHPYSFDAAVIIRGSFTAAWSALLHGNSHSQ